MNFVLISALMLGAAIVNVSLAQDESETSLITKDLHNENPSPSSQQAQMNAQNETISAEQLAELQKQMGTLKEKQEEAKKALEELDQE